MKEWKRKFFNSSIDSASQKQKQNNRNIWWWIRVCTTNEHNHQFLPLNFRRTSLQDVQYHEHLGIFLHKIVIGKVICKSANCKMQSSSRLSENTQLLSHQKLSKLCTSPLSYHNQITPTLFGITVHKNYQKIWKMYTQTQ